MRGLRIARWASALFMLWYPKGWISWRRVTIKGGSLKSWVEHLVMLPKLVSKTFLGETPCQNLVNSSPTPVPPLYLLTDTQAVVCFIISLNLFTLSSSFRSWMGLLELGCHTLQELCRYGRDTIRKTLHNPTVQNDTLFKSCSSMWRSPLIRPPKDLAPVFTKGVVSRTTNMSI